MYNKNLHFVTIEPARFLYIEFEPFTTSFSEQDMRSEDDEKTLFTSCDIELY